MKVKVLNKDLELTDEQEIIRLNKVIDEKNRAISEYKKYDKKRNEYYERLEENYRIMEERFNEFNAALDACDDLEPGTKTYIERVVSRINQKRVNDDIEGGARTGVLTRLADLDKSLALLVDIAKLMPEGELRESMLKEIHATQCKRAGIVTYVKRKLKKIESI